MSIAIKMKVTAVSKEVPQMPGFAYARGPFPDLNPFVYVTLLPAEQRKPATTKGQERFVEAPMEKVRIKSEGEGERDAQIIRPMRQWSESMIPSVPVILTISNEEFESIGRPTLGDVITLTIQKE
jgi:hypothetical protein